MKNYDKLINKINQYIVEVNKNHDDIVYGYYLYRARIYEKQEKFKQALKDINLCLDFEQGAYLIKIRLLISLKKYHEALDFINELIIFDEIYTYCKEIYYQKSYILFLLKRYNEALINADDLIALDPCGTSGYRVKVMILYELGKHNEAQEIVKNALLHRTDKERLKFFKTKKITKSDTIYDDLNRWLWLEQLDVNSIEMLLKNKDQELLNSLNRIFSQST